MWYEKYQEQKQLNTKRSPAKPTTQRPLQPAAIPVSIEEEQPIKMTPPKVGGFGEEGMAAANICKNCQMYLTKLEWRVQCNSCSGNKANRGMH